MRTLWSPRMLGAHLLGLLAVAVAVGLGVWQYEAWQERRSAEGVDLTQREPVPLTAVMGPDDAFPGDRIGQPVSMSGTWAPEATVLVDGRLRDGVGGLWVVTPLLLDQADATVGAAAVPIVVGWVGSQDDVPPAPQGRGELVGWLQPSEGNGAIDDDPTDDVYPQLRTADLAQRVDGDLYSAYAVAQEGIGGLPAADLEALPDAGVFTALKNLLYALEWWVFGAFAGFIWWRYVRDALAEDDVRDPVASGT